MGEPEKRKEIDIERKERGGEGERARTEKRGSPLVIAATSELHLEVPSLSHPRPLL